MTAQTWMEVAQADLGLHEDSQDAQEFAKNWAKLKGLKKVPDLRRDRFHWCSIWIAECLGVKKFPNIADRNITAMAKSWLTFKNADVIFDRRKKIGSPHDGEYGDICIYNRGAPSAGTGHVNFFVGQTSTHIRGIGGNQGDRVSIGNYPKHTPATKHLIAILRPRPIDGVIVSIPPVKVDTASEFEAWFKELLVLEGGLVDDPNDPGGLTNRGVTWKAFVNWRRLKGLPTPSREDLMNMSIEETKEFYLVLYWRAAKTGSLNSASLRRLHADTAVNMGTGTAIRLLQCSLNAFGTGLAVDGQFGTKTSKAEDSVDQEPLMIEYAARRMQRYGGLNGWKHYDLGWSRRLMKVALPAYALFGKAGSKVPVEELPVEDERTPAAWLDDPEFRELVSKGAGLVLDKLLVPIARGIFTKALGWADGWKSVIGLGLWIANGVAANFGVTPVEPTGIGAVIWQHVIDGLSSQAVSIAAPSLLAAGLADKARKNLG